MKSPLFRHLPQLNSLLVFEVAARKQSFRHAAIELSITPSAVAHHIKRLEADLGIELFVRFASGVQISPLGKEYFDQIKPFLHAIDKQSEQISRNYSRPLRILAQHAIAQLWLQTKLGEYQLEYPQHEIQITAKSVLSYLPQDTDIAISFFDKSPCNPQWEYLWEETLIPVSSSSYLENDQPVLYQDLHWEDDWAVWVKVNKSSAAASVIFKQTRRNSLYVLAVNSAVDGLGVVMARRSLLVNELRSQTLVPWRAEQHDITSYGAYYLFQSKQASENPLAQQFCRWLRESI